jgi:hypothetical protein
MSIGTLRSDVLEQVDQSLFGPGSFSVSTRLMQDAVPAQGVSVGSGTNQEALFANPFKDGREEALIIGLCANHVVRTEFVTIAGGGVSRGY